MEDHLPGLGIGIGPLGVEKDLGYLIFVYPWGVGGEIARFGLEIWVGVRQIDTIELMQGNHVFQKLLLPVGELQIVASMIVVTLVSGLATVAYNRFDGMTQEYGEPQENAHGLLWRRIGLFSTAKFFQNLDLNVGKEDRPTDVERLDSEVDLPARGELTP